MIPLLSTAYWPNLHYFYYVLNSPQILIEQHDHYQKQSYRNRTVILSANGKLNLCIPVINSDTKTKCNEVKISYKEKWQINHWRALESAYKNSPYFEYFEEEIRHFYKQPYESLLFYNQEQILLVLKLLKQTRKINLTHEYTKSPEGLLDLREKIHPKKELEDEPELGNRLLTPYYQTFGSKFGFVPNLSILDLLFNSGLKSNDYLKV